MLTGIVNVAPWQASTEAFDIDAALRVVVVLPFAATEMLRPVWGLNVTPVSVASLEVPQPAVWCVLSATIVPLPVIDVTVTGYGLGLLILMLTSLLFRPG